MWDGVATEKTENVGVIFLDAVFTVEKDESSTESSNDGMSRCPSVCRCNIRLTVCVLGDTS